MINKGYSNGEMEYEGEESGDGFELRRVPEEAEEDNKEMETRLTFYAAWSAIFTAFAGLWQYGFAIGSINAVYFPVTSAIKTQYEVRYGVEISNQTVEAIWTIASVAFPIGGIIGSLLVGPVVLRFGRLKGMSLGHLVTVLMCLLSGLSKTIGSTEALIIGRIGIGAMSATVGLGISSMYIVEVSPTHLRGLFGSMVSVMIGVGLMMANVFGLPQALGNVNNWDVLIALAGVPSLLYLLLSKTFAPSPRKLFIEDSNEKEAALVLKRLRGVEDVSTEMAELEAEKKASKTEKQLTVLKLILSKKMRKATITAVVLGAAQQVTGLNGIAANMNNIYIKAGISSQLVYYISIAVTALVVLVQLTAASLTEKCGRKFLLLIGYTIKGVSLVILVIAMETEKYAHAMAYVAVAASLGFWIGFSIGPGPVTFLIISESFVQIARPAAVTLASLAVWIIFSVVMVATPYMLHSIRGYTFLPYGILSFLTAIFIQIHVHETKGRSFAEVQGSFCAGELVNTNAV